MYRHHDDASVASAGRQSGNGAEVISLQEVRSRRGRRCEVSNRTIAALFEEAGREIDVIRTSLDGALDTVDALRSVVGELNGAGDQEAIALKNRSLAAVTAIEAASKAVMAALAAAGLCGESVARIASDGQQGAPAAG